MTVRGCTGVVAVSAGATLVMGSCPTVVRAMMLGGLEPFVFARSSFILFSFHHGLFVVLLPMTKTNTGFETVLLMLT